MNTVISKKQSNKQTDLSSLFESLLNGKKFETAATAHGLAMEPHAKKEIERILKKKHKNFKVFDPGMTVSTQYPFISVSPDLETICDCCGKGVIEIKCPYSIWESKPSPDNLKYLIKENDSITLKVNHNYFCQIQSQMAVTKKNHGCFFVFTHHGSHLEKIEFDELYWSNVEEKLIYFWNEHLAIKILNSKSEEKLNMLSRQNKANWRSLKNSQ